MYSLTSTATSSPQHLAELLANLAQRSLPLDDIAFCGLGVAKCCCILGLEEQQGAALRRIHVRHHHLHFSWVIQCWTYVPFVPISADDLSTDPQLLLFANGAV